MPLFRLYGRLFLVYQLYLRPPCRLLRLVFRVYLQAPGARDHLSNPAFRCPRDHLYRLSHPSALASRSPLDHLYRLYHLWHLQAP